MIILTGGAGFIGSNFLKLLNEKGHTDVLVVDNIENTVKDKNLESLVYSEYVNKKMFWNWLDGGKEKRIDKIIHLGACSDTTENDWDYLFENNVSYSKKLWNLAVEKQIPFIYASSGATYGDGSNGFSDEHTHLSLLKPLNKYGQSKHDFDLWAIEQKDTPPQWFGLKYFNVYGPGESHKGRMASVVFHFLQQLEQGNTVKLFSSSHGYMGGEQKRDFIYIDDVIQITLLFLNNKPSSGIYNIGTGKSRTFNSLASALCNATNRGEIEYIPFPKDLIKNYQPYTQADMSKLNSKGFKFEPTPIEVGVEKYVRWNDSLFND